MFAVLWFRTIIYFDPLIKCFYSFSLLIYFYSLVCRIKRH